MRRQRDHVAEGGQEQLVERYLREHPASTVPQIRDGIEHESGVRIERVQARIDAISQRYELIKSDGDYGRTAYALGRRRRVVRAGGIEIRLVVTEGEGVQLVAHQHGPDIEDEALQQMIGRVLDAAKRAMEARALPLAEAAARAEGLLDVQEEVTEDDWISTLSAYQIDGGV